MPVIVITENTVVQSVVAPDAVYSGLSEVSIRQENAGANYFADPNLALGNGAGEANVAILHLLGLASAAIPVNATVNSASVVMPFNGGGFGSFDISVHASLRPVVLAEATYNDFATGSSWETAGARGALDKSAASDPVTTVSDTDPAVFDISDAMQELITNSGNQLILPPVLFDGDGGFRFFAKSTGTDGTRPEVVIDYSVTGTTVTGPSFRTIQENTPYSDTVQVTNPVGPSTLGGADAGLFTLTDNGTEVIITAPAFDFENPTDSNLNNIYVYEVTNNGATGSGAFQIFDEAVETDTDPDQFTFTDQADVALSTTVTSNTATITGIDAAAPISVTDGEYSIDGGAFTASSGTITAGQTVAVRGTSSANNSTDVSVVLTIGTITDTFTITTAVPLAPPSISSGTTYEFGRSTVINGGTYDVPITVVNATSITGSLAYPWLSRPTLTTLRIDSEFVGAMPVSQTADLVLNGPGGSTNVTLTFTQVDDQAPRFATNSTVNGVPAASGDTIVLTVGDSFVPAYTYTDTNFGNDANVTEQIITNTVDMATPGSYEWRVRITDTAGNSSDLFYFVTVQAVAGIWNNITYDGSVLNYANTESWKELIENDYSDVLVSGGTVHWRVTSGPTTGSTVGADTIPDFAPGVLGGEYEYTHNGVRSSTYTWTIEDFTSATSISGNQNITIAENTLFSQIYIITNPVGPTTLVGADAAQLALTDNGTSVTVSRANSNFEAPTDAGADNIYNAIVRNNGVDWPIALTVTDDPNEFTIDAISNVSINEGVGYASAAPSITGTPEAPVTWSLTGADAALFTVNSSNGVTSMVARTFATPVDANGNNVYEVGLIATDAAGQTAARSWTLTVNNAAVTYEVSGISVQSQTTAGVGSALVSGNSQQAQGVSVVSYTFADSGSAIVKSEVVGKSIECISLAGKTYKFNPRIKLYLH